MVERLSHKLSFPSDHYYHYGKYLLEWWYFWGKIEDKFFHYAEFFTNLGGSKVQTIHYSLDGKFYDEVKDWKEDILSHSGYGIDSFSFTTPKFSIVVKPVCQPVVHDSILNRTYYSIPEMEGYCNIDNKRLNIKAWFDHECNDMELQETITWDWVGLKLNCGINVMVYSSKLENIADVNMGDKVIKTDFILENKHLFLNNLGMYLTLEPLQEEHIFKPRLGVRYSEQPFEVISKSGVIGFGIRERTYREEENGTKLS